MRREGRAISTTPTARLIVTTCLLAALTGCAALPFGTPALSDAPRVPDPRDLRGIGICALLDPTELRRFGLDPASADEELNRETEDCNYHSADYLVGASGTTAYRWNPGGLDRLYLTREFAEIFEPGTVDGFPTVITDANRDDLCDLNVGVADNQLLIVTARKSTRSTAPHSCDQARAIASAVLADLPLLR
ncbi:MAG: DUF3558 domain-containing protein [Pseudonocardia sp.]